MSTRSNSAAIPIAWLCAAAATAQTEAAADEWAAKVKVACDATRYALKRAASDELGRVGDPCVDAITAYIAREGKERIPVLLVDALARNREAGPKTLALLRTWADDREFFWRAQALSGLALRGLEADAERMRKGLSDPSHLYRVAAAKGVHALAKAAGKPWDDAAALLADRDPRARASFAYYLFEAHREPRALPVLVAAVADDRAFLDDDWGRRQALQVMALLGRNAPDFGYRGTESLSTNKDAIGRLAKYYECEMPALIERELDVDLGGVELRSCTHGDLFLRWTERELHFDLDRARRVALSAPAMQRLRELCGRALADEANPRRVLGTVVCDYLQVVTREPMRMWKFAPRKISGDVSAFLRGVVTELRAAEQPALAAELEQRLPQFVRD